MSSEGHGSADETPADGDPDVVDESGDSGVADDGNGVDNADDAPRTRGRDLQGAPDDADWNESSSTASESTDHAVTAADEFGRRGWLLVAAVVVSTLLIPGVVYLSPTVLADRVPFLVAMLVLPFMPAVLLGLIAVWSVTASSRASQVTDGGE